MSSVSPFVQVPSHQRGSSRPKGRQVIRNRFIIPVQQSLFDPLASASRRAANEAITRAGLPSSRLLNIFKRYPTHMHILALSHHSRGSRPTSPLRSKTTIHFYHTTLTTFLPLGTSWLLALLTLSWLFQVLFDKHAHYFIHSLTCFTRCYISIVPLLYKYTFPFEQYTHQHYIQCDG